LSKIDDEKSKNLVWLDMEMSGLNPKSCRILEIAVIVTNENLDIIDEGIEIVIHQSDEHLSTMDEWNQTTHSKSGLVDRVKSSKITELAGEKILLDYLGNYVPKGASPLCGNSIHQDRRFLRLYMPNLDSYFSYRNIDVSTIKELCKRWHPKISKGFTKKGAHTAMADTVESIEELRYYKNSFFSNDE